MPDDDRITGYLSVTSPDLARLREAAVEQAEMHGTRVIGLSVAYYVTDERMTYAGPLRGWWEATAEVEPL